MLSIQCRVDANLLLNPGVIHPGIKLSCSVKFGSFILILFLVYKQECFKKMCKILLNYLYVLRCKEVQNYFNFIIVKQGK